MVLLCWCGHTGGGGHNCEACPPTCGLESSSSSSEEDASESLQSLQQLVPALVLDGCRRTQKVPREALPAPDKRRLSSSMARSSLSKKSTRHQSAAPIKWRRQRSSRSWSQSRCGRVGEPQNTRPRFSSHKNPLTQAAKKQRGTGAWCQCGGPSGCVRREGGAATNPRQTHRVPAQQLKRARFSSITRLWLGFVGFDYYSRRLVSSTLAVCARCVWRSCIRRLAECCVCEWGGRTKVQSASQDLDVPASAIFGASRFGDAGCQKRMPAWQKGGGGCDACAAVLLPCAYMHASHIAARPRPPLLCPHGALGRHAAINIVVLGGGPGSVRGLCCQLRGHHQPAAEASTTGPRGCHCHGMLHVARARTQQQ